MDGFIQTVKYQVGFPDGSVVKNPPTNAGDTIPSLGEEDPLEEEMETHASILAWEIPWTEESGYKMSRITSVLEAKALGSNRPGTDF